MLSKEQFGQEPLPSMPFMPRILHPPTFPETGKPPPGYYHQHGEAQQVLPGMEMSPDEHAKALAEKHGLTGSFETSPEYDSDNQTHKIQMKSPMGAPVASIEWHAPGNQHWYHGERSGEIAMVTVRHQSRRQGIAEDMLTTAERIASEHPEVASPRHSDIRTSHGAHWSQEQMRKRGQEVW